MDLSIIVATRNRSSLLRRLIATYWELALEPATKLELIVVSNGCNDDTREVLVQETEQQTPQKALIPIHRETPGKSASLNFGIGMATGRILAFVDDDVLLDTNWAQNLLKSFTDQSITAVQGAIFLKFSSELWWLTPRVRAILASTDLWSSDIKISSLVGSNMATRNFKGLPLFCEQIGPGVPRFPFGEDLEWSARLLRASQGKFAPDAIVHHCVDGRVTLREIWHRQFHCGFNSFVMRPKATRLRHYLNAVLLLAASIPKAALKSLTGNQLGAVDNFLDAAHAWGTVASPFMGATCHPCW